MENSKKLFEIALALEEPWYIKEIQFNSSSKGVGQLDIYVDFTKGAKFKDGNESSCSVHDTVEKTWQHLDFFQHTCFLHARVPRIKTTSDNVRLVQVPWARPNSGFTLLFEAFAMALIENEMPVNKAASILDVYAKRLWTIFNYWVSRAVDKDNVSDVTQVGIDETSSKKGHRYVTVAADLKQRRVIFATKGKDEQSIQDLHNYLESKNVSADQITHVAIDMSPAFIAGVMNNFPNTSIVFDRFHLKKMLNEALDKVRQGERRIHEQLKGYKYLFLKNQKDLTENQKHSKFTFVESFPKLGESVRLVELFDDFFEFNDKEHASAYLAYWCDLAEDSEIFPFQKVVKTIKSHWTGIINYADAKISNGILEGINSKIQLAKRRARGFRNIQNLINMIYFIAGKLEFDYPRIST
jgi:transposase